MQPSALKRRADERTEEFRERYNPDTLPIKTRPEMYAALKKLMRQVRLQCILVESNGERKMRLLSDIDMGRSWDGANRIFIVTMDGPTDVVYGLAGAYLLEDMERVNDGMWRERKRLGEVTSGSGRGMRLAAELAGYEMDMIVPHQVAANDPARVHALREMGEGEVIVAPEGNAYLVDAVNEYRRRMKEEWAGTHVYPNHSVNEMSVKAAENIGRRVGQLLKAIGAAPGALVSGIGNGSSTLGLIFGLMNDYPKLHCIGVQGCCDPGAYLQKEAMQCKRPLAQTTVSCELQEPSVFAYGIDGSGALTRELGFRFRFADSVIQTVSSLHLVRRREIEELFEQMNKDRPVFDTFGRSTIAALHVARQRRGSDSVIFCGDTAAPYGSHLPSSPNATYVGNGRWTEDFPVTLTP